MEVEKMKMKKVIDNIEAVLAILCGYAEEEDNDGNLLNSPARVAIELLEETIEELKMSRKRQINR
jgi:hypothetical protein